MAPSRWKAQRQTELEVAARDHRQRRGQSRLDGSRSGNAQRESVARPFARLCNNMVQGVSEGFTKDLEIEGVGFKAAVQGQNLNLSLGFSHPILFPIPKDIKITVTENTKINDSGDRQETGRPGRGGYSPILSARAVQGQRRALRRRTNSPQGRQDGSISMATESQSSRGSAFIRGSGRRVSGTAERPRLAVHFSGQACLCAGHR